MSDSVPIGRIERDTINRLLEGVQILDHDWRYLSVNPAAEVHNRRPALELVGKRYQDCWPGIEQTEVYSRIGRVLRDREPDEMENRFAYPDGEIGWFSLRFLPLGDGVLILSIDVSKLRRAEQNLQNTLRLYRTLSEINQAVVRIRETQPLYERVCEVAVRFGGFTVAWIGVLDEASNLVVPQAATGIPLDPWPFPPVSLEKGLFRNGLAAESVRTGKVHAVDDVLTEERGEGFRAVATEWRFRGAAAVPFHTGNGGRGTLVLLSEVPGLLGSESDRSLLEEIGGDLTFALVAIEKERLVRQWADAFAHSAHGIIIGDPDNTVRSCNPAFAAMMRTTTQALEGTAFLETYRPELRAKIEEKIRESDQNGSVRFEAVKNRPDGTSFAALLDVVSVRDPGGTLLYRVTTIQDQSESKRLQAELLQSQRLESLGTLSSGVAHDFNNLLGVILGNAELLRQFPTDQASSDKRLGAIVSAGHRGADLVKQLLTFARKTDLHHQAVDLNKVVNEVQSLLAETLPRSIAVRIVPDPMVPPIWADASQVNQVLVNLAVNARDAMPDGGTLTISTSSEVRDEVPFAVLTVSDTGTGMDPATKARIFEPFFTTKSIGQGTGLGLSTVFGILQGHEGSVEVESQEGVGSSFRCRFPASPTVEAPAPLKRPPVGVSGGTVLLVEDEPNLREVVTAQLAIRGIRVLVAADAIEASLAFQGHQREIALVVSDLGLPGSPGGDLFRVLKSLDRGVQFVLVSGYFEPGLQAQLKAEGVLAFLQKPYDADEIVRLLPSPAQKKTDPRRGRPKD